MRHFNPALKSLLVAICVLYLPAAQAATFSGKVVGIADGDTLTVLNENKRQVKIRLAEIDAPESGQRFGAKSKQSLSQLCFGKQAEVVPRAIDRYKRTVARVKCADVDANAEQVNRGMAWVYRKYAKDNYLYVLQHEAKSAERGLWSDPSPIPPSAWRQQQRQM
jgi:endonuclease YncB( thermonuclease family)